MDHKSFLIQLQSRLGKDKGEIDSYMSAFLQILKERCSQNGHSGNTRIRVIRA